MSGRPGALKQAPRQTMLLYPIYENASGNSISPWIRRVSIPTRPPSCTERSSCSHFTNKI